MIIFTVKLTFSWKNRNNKPATAILSRKEALPFLPQIGMELYYPAIDWFLDVNSITIDMNTREVTVYCRLNKTLEDDEKAKLLESGWTLEKQV